jgi:hypothetical protein
MMKGRSSMRNKQRTFIALAVAVLLAVAGLAAYKPAVRMYLDYKGDRARSALFTEIKPVRLNNCSMERIGNPNDGGYVVCENLLSGTEVAYSYGIGGEDGWGCDISRRLGIKVHQYDCFDEREPLCPGGQFVFHRECVGDRKETIENRLFDTLSRQITKNGDSGKNLLVKMDVEGAEWDSLMATPEDVFDGFGQLIVEFHGVSDGEFVKAMRRLKEQFYIADIHFNNNTCVDWAEPFPSWVFEALLVNKKIGEPDESGSRPVFPNPKHARNNLDIVDCQVEIK